MNLRIISKVLGVLLILMGLAMLACLLYAWYEGKHGVENPAVRALSKSAAITGGVGLVLYLIGLRTPDEILRREAIVIVGLGWLVSALFGALPFLLCKPALDFPKALFESMSGFTTTGSTVIRDLSEYPHSILLWRSLTQWLGGIGILVLFVAVLSFLGVGSRSLVRHESSVNVQEGNMARIKDVAVNLWRIYIGLTVICGLGLWALGMPPLEAVMHAFTAVSTGGFSPKNTSIGFYGSLGIEIWLTVFMLLGGISFMLYVMVIKGAWKRVRADEEARIYVIGLLVVWAIVAANLSLTGENESFGEGLRKSFFTVVSISTTTGYGTEDFDQWPTFSKIILLLLMLMGGCAGSTAGGVKVSRMILFAKIWVQELVKTYRPNRVFRLRINGHPAEEGARQQTSFFLAMALMVWLLGVLLVSLLEPEVDLATGLSAVSATLFNIGPGLAAVGPTQNFADFGSGTLLLFSLLMVLGRLEFFAILVLFLPSLWKKY